MKAENMGFYTEDEFMNLASLRVDSAEKLKNMRDELRAELRDVEKFQEIYRYSFSWAKDSDKKILGFVESR